MEDRRARLEKSPAIPIPIPPPLTFTALSPTTLSRAFQMHLASSYMSRARSTSNLVIERNVPPVLISEVEGFSSPCNKSLVIHLVSKSAPTTTITTTTRQPLQTLEQVLEKEMTEGCNVRKLRRKISNRLSAQRSRLKNAQHITEMEGKIKDLQETISIITPEIENHIIKQKALQIQKANLEQQLHSAITRSNLYNIEIEENKREVLRLKELQRQQMLFASNFGKKSPPPPPFFNMQNGSNHHSQLFLDCGSSSFQHHEEPENTNTDPTLVDQYINFDALNCHPNKN